MKIRIDVKWLIAAIVLFAGISIAASYPTITATELFIGYVHADCSNCSNLPAAQVVGNFTQRINFSNRIYATGLSTLAGVDDNTCIDPVSKEITTSNTACTSSTRASKQNIRNTEDGSLNKINQLEVVSYEFKDDVYGRTESFLTAEQVKDVLPGCVAYDQTKTQIKGIYERCILGNAIKAIQEQSVIINRQTDAINQLIALQGANASIAPLPTTSAPWWKFW